ncbi:PqqD family peptide modification chaperone [Butyrivibrio sp. VCD2006]|uniref:PqqD family peptide modification chaperone n=1 Tax=Butyrivibrio sp. VCD2006 TaxID=1280664 RepID=UPI00040E02A4|nr:PqqD family peptide modification chaperone [Butyrivibrio sp. VCD2006]
MNKDTKIKLIKHINVTDMAGDKVMIDFENGKYYMLKGTAVDIWDNIQTETTVGALLNTMLDLYEIDEATCLSGIEKFLQQLESSNFITLFD